MRWKPPPRRPLCRKTPRPSVEFGKWNSVVVQSCYYSCRWPQGSMPPKLRVSHVSSLNRFVFSIWRSRSLRSLHLIARAPTVDEARLSTPVEVSGCKDVHARDKYDRTFSFTKAFDASASTVSSGTLGLVRVMGSKTAWLLRCSFVH